MGVACRMLPTMISTWDRAVTSLYTVRDYVSGSHQQCSVFAATTDLNTCDCKNLHLVPKPACNVVHTYAGRSGRAGGEVRC
jgi:hypothetical protein